MMQQKIKKVAENKSEMIVQERKEKGIKISEKKLKGNL